MVKRHPPQSTLPRALVNIFRLLIFIALSIIRATSKIMALDLSSQHEMQQFDSNMPIIPASIQCCRDILLFRGFQTHHRLRRTTIE